MKLFSIAFSMTLSVTVFAQHSTDTSKTFQDGTPFEVVKVYHDRTDTQRVAIGKYVQIHIIQKLKGSTKKDTTMMNSYERGVQGVEIVTQMLEGEQAEAFPIFKHLLGLQVGDSMIVKPSIIKILEKQPQAKDMLGEAGNLEISYKIHNLFNTMQAYLEVTKKKKQLELEAYVSSNNMMEYYKEVDGIYVMLKNPQMPGAPKITKGTKVKVNYTGSLLNGKIFDSNIQDVPGRSNAHDAAERTPLAFTVGAGQMIPGFDAAMKYVGKGGKATVVLPYAKAYGEAGQPQGGIDPYETLVFDVEIVDVEYASTTKVNKPKAAVKSSRPTTIKKKTPYKRKSSYK